MRVPRYLGILRPVDAEFAADLVDGVLVLGVTADRKTLCMHGLNDEVDRAETIVASPIVDLSPLLSIDHGFLS